jgi:hypothetical protein
VPPDLSLVEGPDLSVVAGPDLSTGAFFRAGRAFDPDAAARRFDLAAAFRRSRSDRFFVVFRELAAFLRVVVLCLRVLAAGVRLLADDRALDRARLFDALRVGPFLERFRAAPAVFRFAAFFAMVVDLASGKRTQDRPRPPCTLTGGL